MRASGDQILRLKRILPLLCCPACRGDLIVDWEKATLVSAGCGAIYVVEDGVPILLRPSLRDQGLGGALPPDQHASMHPYSPDANSLIEAHSDGWVLDLGAGGKAADHPHVIQVDVFRFPMVDVVASADALPFRDNVLDAVVSQAVFEHLQYPDVAASEIWRVLKPAGIAKIDTAFLQPEHAYPHHYFNATEAGLRHWFRDFDVQWSGVEAYQHPQWALEWFLSVYLAGLHDDHKTALESLTVGECAALLKRLARNEALTSDGSVVQALQGLAPDTVRKLAAGVSLRAVKQLGVRHVDRKEASGSSGALLELERRNQVQAAQIAHLESDEVAREELFRLSMDRSLFLTHQYELNCMGPLSNPGFFRPLALLILRQISRTMPPSLCSSLVGKIRRLKASHVGLDPQIALSNPVIVFWCRPQNAVDLLNQFFSLVHQSRGDWRYVVLTGHDQSDALKRMIGELSSLDKRVIVWSSDETELHAWVGARPILQLGPNTVLAFHAVEELMTLHLARPGLWGISADYEVRVGDGRASMRCWCTELDTNPEGFLMEFVLKTQPIPRIKQDFSETVPESYAHIPKVLFRINKAFGNI